MKKCPKCGSKNVARIMYGMLLFSDELMQKINSGKIILGGCCISNMDPKYHCNECGERFGYPKDI